MGEGERAREKAGERKRHSIVPFNRWVDMAWWATSQVLIRCLNATWPFSAQCRSDSFRIKLLLQLSLWDGSLLFTAAAVSVSETVIPQCFAKAGKMEPNHLLNGFGPLQPAVAMLWWLQGAPFAVMPSTQSLQWQQAASWWFSTNKIWSVWWFSCSMLNLSDFWLIKKPIPASYFSMVHFPDWVLPLCLQWEC